MLLLRLRRLRLLVGVGVLLGRLHPLDRAERGGGVPVGVVVGWVGAQEDNKGCIVSRLTDSVCGGVIHRPIMRSVDARTHPMDGRR